jgi:hypothetical protein
MILTCVSTAVEGLSAQASALCVKFAVLSSLSEKEVSLFVIVPAILPKAMARSRKSTLSGFLPA